MTAQTRAEENATVVLN